MSAVESPNHYTQGYMEVIYVIEQVLGKDGFKSFCLGNWIKYKTRHEHKNGKEDLAKAEQYLAWANNGLPSPVNGMVPREVKKVAKLSENSSGALSAVLQHELDIMVPGVWRVLTVSMTPVQDHYQVYAHIETGPALHDERVRVSLPHVAGHAAYGDIVGDLIAGLKKAHPQGPWRIP